MKSPVIHYIRKIEDRIRERLARYPIVYTLIGAVAIVIFWRGVWITADDISANIPEALQWIDGPLSVITSVIVLLVTGLFVSFFVNDQIILSGVKREEKLAEKTEGEVKKEGSMISDVLTEMRQIESNLEQVKQAVTNPPKK